MLLPAALRRPGLVGALICLFASLPAQAESPASAPPVILGAGPMLIRNQRWLRTPGERVRWSIVSGHGTLSSTCGAETLVTAGGLWGPLVVRAQRAEPPSCASEATLEVELPTTQVTESEVRLQPAVRQVHDAPLLDQGAATLVFQGNTGDLAALSPGDFLAVEGDEGQTLVRQIAGIQTVRETEAPPALRRLLAGTRGRPLAGTEPRVATVLSTLTPAPKDVFKSIHHRSSFRLDMESMFKGTDWERVKSWMPGQVTISVPALKGREGGVTFAFDDLRIFEWQGRTLSFSGSITLTGAIEHATQVEMDTPRGYSEQRFALRVAYQGALVANLADFSWPAEGDYQRLLPMPLPLHIPLGAATLSLRLFPFYLKAKGWLDGELNVNGEIEVDQVIRKNLVTGEITRSGPGFSWPLKAEISLALDARIKMFLGFFPLELGLGFAGLDFAGFACPMGMRGSLSGRLDGVLGGPKELTGCASLSWDTEFLFYLRYPASLLGWFNPSAWGFHKNTLMLHTFAFSGRSKNCLDEMDRRHPLELLAPRHRIPPSPQPPSGGLGGTWFEGRVGQPVTLRLEPEEEFSPRPPTASGSLEVPAWSQLDGPCPIHLEDPTSPDLVFVPPQPGRYSFQFRSGAETTREVDVRILEKEEDPRDVTMFPASISVPQTPEP